MGTICGFLIDQINSNWLDWDVDLTFQALCGSVIITLMELVIGMLDKAYLHLNQWDYSKLYPNYQGVIRLQFNFLWFLLSFIVILVCDAINYYLLIEDPCPKCRIGIWTFSMPKRRS